MWQDLEAMFANQFRRARNKHILVALEPLRIDILFPIYPIKNTSEGLSYLLKGPVEPSKAEGERPQRLGAAKVCHSSEGRKLLSATFHGCHSPGHSPRSTFTSYSGHLP